MLAIPYVIYLHVRARLKSYLIISTLKNLHTFVNIAALFDILFDYSSLELFRNTVKYIIVSSVSRYLGIPKVKFLKNLLHLISKNFFYGFLVFTKLGPPINQDSTTLECSGQAQINNIFI